MQQTGYIFNKPLGRTDHRFIILFLYFVKYDPTTPQIALYYRKFSFGDSLIYRKTTCHLNGQRYYCFKRHPKQLGIQLQRLGFRKPAITIGWENLKSISKTLPLKT